MGARSLFSSRNPAGRRPHPRWGAAPGATLLLATVLLTTLVLSGCSMTTGGDDGRSESTVVTHRLSSTSLLPTTSSTEPPFTQQPGEIFLEAAGQAGPESFTGETFLPVGPPSTLNIPTTTIPPAVTSSTDTASTTTTTAPGGAIQLTSYSGDTPALYGGSKSKKQVDKEGQLRFFEQNPAKAAAFCAALNSDPTFRWSGGSQIRPDQLRAYFDELTPVMLTRDTRVTNHGYRDGRPTPRQAVLQKGQYVLVDLYGVPRVRCECGNPLTPPQPVPTTPTYTGPRWPDFDPTVIVVIVPAPAVIETIILVDIATGGWFERPPGSDGAMDAITPASMWDLHVRMDIPGGPVEWTATIGIGPDGTTLSGSTQGIWRCDGYTWRDTQDNKTGTWQADVSYAVEISGTVESTPTGRVLHVVATPAYVTIENVDIDNQIDSHAGIRADLDRDIPQWLSVAFVPIDLPAVDYGPVYATLQAADGSQGNATLTALR